MIENARITSTFLGREDHGIPTCSVTLDYGGVAQSFGGYDLRYYGIEFITKLLDTLEVGEWSALVGQVVRADHTRASVDRIGHIIKDQWFNPSELKGKKEDDK